MWRGKSVSLTNVGAIRSKEQASYDSSMTGVKFPSVVDRCPDRNCSKFICVIRSCAVSCFNIFLWSRCSQSRYPYFPIDLVMAKKLAVLKWRSKIQILIDALMLKFKITAANQSLGKFPLFTIRLAFRASGSFLFSTVFEIPVEHKQSEVRGR